MVEEQCKDGEPYLHHIGFHIVLFLHLVISILAVLANLIFLKYSFHRIYFHKNVRLLIAASLICNIFHSAPLGLLQMTHLILYKTASTACDILVPVYFCLVLRVPVSTAMCAFVTLNSAIVLERFLATIRLKTYEKERNALGNMLWICSVLVAFIFVIISQRNTPLAGSEYYCSGANAYTTDAVTFFSYLMVVMELIALLVFCVSYRWNMMKKRTRNYHVNLNYQINENIASHQMLLPFIAFHFVIFLLFNLGTALAPNLKAMDPTGMAVRTAYAAVYIIPAYSLFSPMLLWFIGRKQARDRRNEIDFLSKRKASADAYLKYLKEQWA